MPFDITASARAVQGSLKVYLPGCEIALGKFWQKWLATALKNHQTWKALYGDPCPVNNVRIFSGQLIPIFLSRRMKASDRARALTRAARARPPRTSLLFPAAAVTDPLVFPPESPIIILIIQRHFALRSLPRLRTVVSAERPNKTIDTVTAAAATAAAPSQPPAVPAFCISPSFPPSLRIPLPSSPAHVASFGIPRASDTLADY